MNKLLTAAVAAALIFGALAGAASAAAPQNQSKPTISGTLETGQTLTADPGTWSGNPISFVYQWQRCSPAGDQCGDIQGAKAKTYKLTDTDVGNTVRVQVTAANADGANSDKSETTSIISGNASPRNSTKPTVSGKAVVGETLTADPGTWSEGPTFSYQWQSCDKNGGTCSDIQGATGKTYGVRSSDVGNTIRIHVIAKNAVDSNSANSYPTAVVTSGTNPTPAPVGVGAALSISAISLPDRLVISQIKFTPNVVRSRTQPITARFRITDTQQSRPVSGALVYAIGVPSNRVSVGPEVTTDGTGWATMTFNPLRGLPLKRGAQLTFFVRARKPGDNVLAGVSTRRLVSVRVSP
jgi:hypothetical protein